MTNSHKNMELISFWFKRREYYKLISAIDGNWKDEVFDILFKMKQRGDLK